MNPSEAKRWMEYAKSDLDAAHTRLNSGEFFPRQICFMAQQAGEKALKAILVYLEIPFPHTHDLDRIRELIPEGWEIKEKFPRLYDFQFGQSSHATLVTRLMWLNMKRARLFVWQKPCSMQLRMSWKNDFNLQDGDSDMPKYAPLCSNVLKVSNLRELVNAVDTLLVG